MKLKLLSLFLLLLGMNSMSEAAHFLTGSEDAKVQILIWGDFQCNPTKFQIDNIAQFKLDFGNRIGISYGLFPFDEHPEGVPSATAAQCADDQGMFGPFIDSLFEHQQDLSHKFYLDTAIKVGIPDPGAFQACLESPITVKRVKAERASGRALGVFGTPSTYINGKLILGGMPYEDLKAAIDKAISQAQ